MAASEVVKAAQRAISKGERTWRELSAEELAAIEELRQEPLGPCDPKGNYKKICPPCTKPNAPEVDFCTGCGFALVPSDLKKVSLNPFLDLINGEDTGTVVHYRDDDFLVFDDKFGVSKHHLQIIPTRVIDDVLQLTRADLPMLERMRALGLSELRRRADPRFAGDDVEQVMTCGFNFPVSVLHLHLHMALPPFAHEKVFLYPRWHSYDKVVGDLRDKGKVTSYQDTPDDEAGAAAYAHAMAGHRNPKYAIS